MRLIEIKSREPLIVTLLKKLLDAKKPVFYLSPSVDGKPVLNEIELVEPEVLRYSKGASKEIAGQDCTSVKFKAPKRYSWETDDTGEGFGNGFFTIPHIDTENLPHYDFVIKKLPSVQGRKDYIIGTRRDVNAWEKQNEDK